jgi:hypothetical protein
MGYFRPSHALSVEELGEAGVKDLDRLTQPYIRQVGCCCWGAGVRDEVRVCSCLCASINLTVRNLRVEPT